MTIVDDIQLPPPPPAPLRLTRIHDHTGAIRLAVAGEVDLSNSDALRDTIRALLARPGLVRLHLDLAELTFIDSSGAQVLLAGKRAAVERQIGFRVVNPTGSVLRVLQILGADKLLTRDDG